LCIVYISCRILFGATKTFHLCPFLPTSQFVMRKMAKSRKMSKIKITQSCRLVNIQWLLCRAQKFMLEAFSIVLWLAFQLLRKTAPDFHFRARKWKGEKSIVCIFSPIYCFLHSTYIQDRIFIEYEIYVDKFYVLQYVICRR
jgi:hypothetical protein